MRGLAQSEPLVKGSPASRRGIRRSESREIGGQCHRGQAPSVGFPKSRALSRRAVRRGARRRGSRRIGSSRPRVALHPAAVSSRGGVAACTGRDLPRRSAESSRRAAIASELQVALLIDTGVIKAGARCRVGERCQPPRRAGVSSRDLGVRAAPRRRACGFVRSPSSTRRCQRLLEEIRDTELAAHRRR